MGALVIPAVLWLVEHVGGVVLDSVTHSTLAARLGSIGLDSNFAQNALKAIEGSIGKLEDVQKQKLSIELATLQGQLSLDAQDDASPDRFKSYWRPFVAWGLGSLLVIHQTIVELINALHVVGYNVTQIAPLDNNTVFMICSLLGIYTGARTLEKVRGQD